MIDTNFYKGLDLMNILRFAAIDAAIQHLSNLTNSRIIIAKTLKQLMPELIKRVKDRNVREWDSDEEIQRKILEIAEMDPKNEGNPQKSSKIIHVLLEWYLKHPGNFERVLGDEEFKEDLRKFNIFRGQGKINKSLKDFNDPKELVDHLIEVENQIEQDQREQLLKNPILEMNGYKAYVVDGTWDEIGRALFEDQTKWCVNEESNYEGYKPLWLFTKTNGSYYALFSPSDDMFNNAQNDALETDEIEELMPLIEKLDLEDEFERSNAGENWVSREPPYDEQHEYELGAWHDWVSDEYMNALDVKFSEELEEESKSYKSGKLEIGTIPDKELRELFQEVAENNDIYWEWERDDYNRVWNIYINVKEIAEKTTWQDVLYRLTDDVERSIMDDDHYSVMRSFKQLSEKRKKYLREKYPQFFREIAEKHGQRKLFEFASVDDAIQYLSNITGKRIKVAVPLVDVSEALRRKMERDLLPLGKLEELPEAKNPKIDKLEASLKKLAELVADSANEDEFIRAVDKLGTVYMHPIDINRKLFTGEKGKRKFYQMVREKGIENIPLK
jgi:hypothetical protein